VATAFRCDIAEICAADAVIAIDSLLSLSHLAMLVTAIQPRRVYAVSDLSKRRRLYREGLLRRRRGALDPRHEGEDEGG